MTLKELKELRKTADYTVNNPDPIFNQPSRVELERAELRARLDPWPSYQEKQWKDATVFEKIKCGSEIEFLKIQRIKKLTMMLKNKS